MSLHFPSVWYATSEKVASIRKTVAFSDRGKLEVAADRMTFIGKAEPLSLSHIRGVSFARQQIPWVTYVIANGLLIAYFVFLKEPAMGYLGMAVMMIVLNSVGLLIGGGTRWVLVEYQDEQGHPQRAYFADGSAAGWGGILGGTKTMYRAIVSFVNQAKKDSE